ncbi:MAG: redox-regulated ATPase YchF, partial [Cytophagales bacterium]|nr:redox-regulated ATPase YchF [Cytophagales bacterium]
MTLSCGIVGLPNVGKSTLFSAASGQKVVADNFPFCTIEPNRGLAPVSDPRMSVLERLVQPEKVVPSVVKLVDIAGLVRGSHQGEGLGNQFLSHIMEVSLVVHVVRCFDSENIIHIEGKVDPVRDRNVVETELQLKDLEMLSKRHSKLEKLLKAGKNGKAKEEMSLIKSLQKELEEGRSLRLLDLSAHDQKLISALSLLSLKPLVYVANVHEKDVVSGNAHVEALKKDIKEESSPVVLLSSSLEAQLLELLPEERREFLRAYHLEAPCLDVLVRTAYKYLNLITFFTAGPQELRAWPLRRSATAWDAAGVIHSDFQKNFIKADVA